MEENQQSFEHSLYRLEEIVGLLESGRAPLSELLALFEEGAGIVKKCHTELDEAEEKVQLLVESQDGTPSYRSFEESPRTQSNMSLPEQETGGYHDKNLFGENMENKGDLPF